MLFLKKFAGRMLWLISGKCFRLRRLLRPAGMRTQKEWFSGRCSTLPFPNGKILRFSGVEQNYFSFELHWKDWSYFEPISMLLFRELLENRETFYDVGASNGYYALFAASERPDMAIVAFEPNPKVFRLLEKNAEINRATIRCESLALSDGSGGRTFLLPESDMSGTLEEGFHVLRREKDLRRETVQTTTLDAYVESHPPAGAMLLKVDVEGHEASFLRGAAQTLQRIKPDLIMEVSFDHHPATEAFLREIGYYFYPIRREGLRPVEHLCICREDSVLYLNYLISTATPEEVGALFERIRPAVNRLDLKASSLYRAPEQHRLDSPTAASA